MVNREKIRQGVAVSSEFPPTPFLFSRKSLAKNNILVGDDKAQIRFFKQVSGLEVETVGKVTDDMLLGSEGLLFHVHAEHQIDLSPDVKKRTGIWSADEITKGSAGANAIVKHAASLLGLSKLPRETVEIVSEQITKHGVADIRGALWEAVWILSTEVKAPTRWNDPWKDPRNWMDKDDPVHRLHSLYKSLVGWSYLITNDTKGARAFGISPSHQQFLKNLKLDRRRVYESIKVLSGWKKSLSDPYVCALRITTIWS